MGMHRRLLAAASVLLLALPAAPSRGAPVAALPVPVGYVAASGADFAAMRRSGARAVRLLADWSAIEPDRGVFQWAALDRAVTAAARAGLTVTLVLAFTPRWASLATGAELDDPAIWSRQPPAPGHLADWQHFVDRAARRYRGRVREWQVWTVLTLPIWRGTAREYFALVTAARTATKAVDPQSRIILATPAGADLIAVRRAVREIPDAFDAVSLSPKNLAPEALLRPLGTLRDRVLEGRRKGLRLEWDPRAAGGRAAWGVHIAKVLTVAAAFGVERVDLVVDPPLASPVLEAVAAATGGASFTGYLSQGRALAFVFGRTAPSAIVWSAEGETAVAFEGEGLSVSTLAGAPVAATGSGGRTAVAVGSEPLIVRGLPAVVAEAAAAALTADPAPVFPGARDYSRAAVVTARLGRVNVEDGLYNMPFRTRAGAVEPVEVAGAEAVRTNAAREIVYVYFDIDDSFIYYVDGRYAVEITVEVLGAAAPEQVGFNIFYDSMTDLRFTRRQIVEAKEGWVTYTIRLLDAAFANTWGWDFAINAAGNRVEDLTVRTVTVRKLPR
jgi:hypothetical protein